MSLGKGEGGKGEGEGRTEMIMSDNETRRTVHIPFDFSNEHCHVSSLHPTEIDVTLIARPNLGFVGMLHTELPVLSEMHK